MSIKIIIPARIFREALDQFVAHSASRLRCTIGLNSYDGETELLVRSLSPTANLEQLVISTATGAEPDFSMLISAFTSPFVRAHIVFGRDLLKGRIWGISTTQPFNDILNDTSVILPISSISLPGSQMLKFEVKPIWENEKREDERHQVWNVERYSRTIGAIGLENWQRLTGLHVAVVGCGRTGSMVATTLARMGVRNLTLVDPDRVEQHNLGEMDGVNDNDIGQNKATSLSRFLMRNCIPQTGDFKITAVNRSIIEAYPELISCDVIFSTVDNDIARLTSGLIAASFHKVLIDIGTGIIPIPSKPQALNSSVTVSSGLLRGADIRMLLPAEGCIRCFGGLVNYDAALAILAQGKDKLSSDERQEWWEQRPGSLRYLNSQAAGIAVHLLCDLISLPNQQTNWIQLQIDAAGNYKIERLVREELEPTRNCPLCQRAGIGKDGLNF